VNLTDGQVTPVLDVLVHSGTCVLATYLVTVQSGTDLALIPNRSLARRLRHGPCW
jgi:hypothetical protein